MKLQELLANQPLAMVYVLKGVERASGKRVEDGDDGGAGCGESSPLQRFSRNLSEIYAGILASANYRSVLEGLNNKIKVIKRMAYGFLITMTSQLQKSRYGIGGLTTTACPNSIMPRSKHY